MTRTVATAAAPWFAVSAGWAEELATAGFCRPAHADLRRLLSDADLQKCRGWWDDLEVDTALPDGGTYRYRRYGRLCVEVRDDEFVFTGLPHAPFQQAVEHVPSYGGRARVFPPIPEEVLLSTAIRALVAADLSVVVRHTPRPRWIVGLHMVRVVAVAGTAGQPTPEGLHRDGHDYVGMHLINRRDCAGGESMILRDGAPPVRFTLTDCLDSVIVDDDTLRHAVSAIIAERGTGVRDTLLVDLNIDRDASRADDPPPPRGGAGTD